jgi:hypothetical protein
MINELLDKRRFPGSNGSQNVHGEDMELIQQIAVFPRNLFVGFEKVFRKVDFNRSLI